MKFTPIFIGLLVSPLVTAKGQVYKLEDACGSDDFCWAGQEVGDSDVSLRFNITAADTVVPTYDGSCGEDDVCPTQNVYFPDDSDKFQANDSAPHYKLADFFGEVKTGNYCTDQVKLSSDSFSLEYSFAGISYRGGNTGQVGLAFPEAESTNQGDDGYTYANFLEALKQSGKLAKTVFSVYSTSLKKKTRSVLFGGIDTQKLAQGGLTTYNLYNPLSFGKEEPIKQWGIVMDYLVVDNDDSVGPLEMVADSSNYTTVLDFFSSETYLAPELFTKLAEQFDIKYDEENQYFESPNYASCKKLKNKSLGFFFGDVHYYVDLSDLVVQEYNDNCYLSLFSNYENYNKLGSPTLSRTYAVYDYEDKQLSLGLIFLNNGEVDANEDIYTVSDKIPSATLNSKTPTEGPRSDDEMSSIDPFATTSESAVDLFGSATTTSKSSLIPDPGNSGFHSTTHHSYASLDSSASVNHNETSLDSSLTDEGFIGQSDGITSDDSASEETMSGESETSISGEESTSADAEDTASPNADTSESTSSENSNENDNDETSSTESANTFKISSLLLTASFVLLSFV